MTRNRKVKIRCQTCGREQFVFLNDEEYHPDIILNQLCKNCEKFTNWMLKK